MHNIRTSALLEAAKKCFFMPIVLGIVHVSAVGDSLSHSLHCRATKDIIISTSHAARYKVLLSYVGWSGRPAAPLSWATA